MKRQRPLHTIILQQGLEPSHLLQNLRGKILAVQQQAELRLVERWIIKQRKKYVGRMMMQQRRQLFAAGRACSLAIEFVTVHPIPSRPEPPPPQEKRAIFPSARYGPLSSTQHRRPHQNTATAPSSLPRSPTG